MIRFLGRPRVELYWLNWIEWCFIKVMLGQKVSCRVDALKRPLRHNNAILNAVWQISHPKKIKSHKKKNIQPYQQNVCMHLLLATRNSVCFSPWKMCSLHPLGAPGKSQDVCFVSPQLRHLHGAKSCAPESIWKKMGGITPRWDWALAGLRGHYMTYLGGIKLDGNMLVIFEGKASLILVQKLGLVIHNDPWDFVAASTGCVGWIVIWVDFEDYFLDRWKVPPER